MARRKRKFKRVRQGIKVNGNQLTITCYECNLVKEFERNGEDTDQILDREAVGWYTLFSGIALCPRHIHIAGVTNRLLYPLSEVIYGDPEARKLDLEQYLARTRRRMERASWKSETSDDSTT